MGDFVDWGVALLVGNKARSSHGLRTALETRFRDVVAATSLERAVERLTSGVPIAFALVDIDSLQGAVWIAIAARRRMPTPIVFAVHEQALSAADAFALGRWGVDRLFDGPLGSDVLLAELDAAREEPLPDVASLVAPFVGRVGLFDFEEEARQAFVDQAINRAVENRSRAARLLQVPRPVLQRALARKGIARHDHDHDPGDDLPIAAE